MVKLLISQKNKKENVKSGSENRKLTFKLIKLTSLKEIQILRMYNLMCDSYNNMSEIQFREDLQTKDYVGLLVNNLNEIYGFTTIKVNSVRIEGVNSIFSGDTIIDKNYWGKKILNSSENFDYDLWKEKFRYTANKHIKTDTRNHPLALEEVDKSNEFRIDCSAGDLVVFSGCHLHGTIPNVTNKTRFSIDFRIISKDLFERNIGINIDSKSIGSTISDFKNSLNLKNYSLSNNK